MMSNSNILIAFCLTILAGLSTGIGSWLIFLTRHTSRSFLSFSLGLAAGVLLFVSFVELFPESQQLFAHHARQSSALLLTVLSFLGGLFFMTVVDFLLPHHHNDAASQMETHTIGQLKRIGYMIALAITLHNIPEGIAVFSVSISNYRLALPIILAIIIHNIPLGMSISAPIYHATGKKGNALVVSLLSGLATPFGALLAWLFLLPYWTPILEAVIFGAVAGTMVYVAINELIPSAEQYGKHSLSRAGVLTGMGLMALAILILE